MTALLIPLRDRARGHWHHILTSLGMDARYLSGKNGPCPVCRRGRNRWRFLDYNGSGAWICNQCSNGVQDGFTLAMEFTGCSFKDVAREIERIIGDARPAPPPPPKRDPSSWLRGRWDEAEPVRRGDVVDRYLRGRGVGLDLYPRCLRAARLWHSDARAEFPGMLARVTGPDGRLLTLHRTFLALDGLDKAPVEKPRMLCSELNGSPPVICLTRPAAVMGVAEGIEMALAAAKLFGVPTWSAICDWGVERFEPPPEAKRIIIFGDNDANGTGQGAAHALAARLAGRLKVDVRIPEKAKDWNDTLLRERGQ
jgi:putative DNA primase/helicase